MTATTALPPPPPAPPARSGSRTAAIAVASVMAALSLAAFALGGVALWGDAQRDDDGYISTATHRFTASTSALTTEEIDIGADVPRWAGGDDAVYGKWRMRVESRDGGPVFAGVARTSDVERYLAGAAHTVVTDIDTDPFDATYAVARGRPDAGALPTARTSGSPRPRAPAGARSTGTSATAAGRSS